MQFVRYAEVIGYVNVFILLYLIHVPHPSAVLVANITSILYRSQFLFSAGVLLVVGTFKERKRQKNYMLSHGQQKTVFNARKAMVLKRASVYF